jgi:glycerate kinase
MDLSHRDSAVLGIAAASGLSLVPEEKKIPPKMTPKISGKIITYTPIEVRATESVIMMGRTATHNDGLGIHTALESTTHDRPHSAPLPIYWIYITIRGFGKSVWKIDRCNQATNLG